MCKLQGNISIHIIVNSNIPSPSSFYPTSEVQRQDSPEQRAKELLPSASDSTQKGYIQNGYDSEDGVYSVESPLELWYTYFGYLPVLVTLY